MPSIWKEFNRKLRDSKRAVDVLSLLACGEWHKKYGQDKACPKDRIPSVETLTEWLPNCPRQSWNDAWERAEPLLEEQTPLYLMLPARAADWGENNIYQNVADAKSNGRPIREHWLNQLPLMHSVISSEIENLHYRWTRTTEGKHPLGPLVASWQERPLQIEADSQENGIMPQPLENVRSVRIIEHRAEQDHLSGTSCLAELSEQEQGYLPGLEPASTKVVAVLPLVAFDVSGGLSLARGRGAPLALRLFTETLLAVPRMERGKAVHIVKTTRELIAELWPNRKPRWSERKNALKTALWTVHNAMVPYDGDHWIPIVVRRFPDRLAGETILEVDLPPGSDRGPLVHKPTLRLQGVRSAPAYRAYLGLCAMRNTYGTHGGALLPVRVPEVLRDSTGALRDARGQVVVGKGNVAVKHWHDKRAVRTGRLIRNAEMWNRLPWLTDSDLIALCYPAMPRNPANRRWYLKQAKATLAKMRSDGLVAIEREYPQGRTERSKGCWKIALTDRSARA